MTMSATDRFFQTLADRKHEELLEKTSGKLRFDLSHGEQTDHWMVTVKDGDLAVSRDDEADADSIVRMPRNLFDQLVAGRVNAFTALLRGEAAVKGNLELPVLLQRLLPGPPRGEQPRPEAEPTPPPGFMAGPEGHAGAGTGVGIPAESGRR
jgi:putative sterol carrier protein